MAAKKAKSKPKKSPMKPEKKVSKKASKKTSKSKVSYLPKGFTSITPHLTIRSCAEAIEFYKKAFGAKQLTGMPGPGGKIMHATLRIGDGVIMVNDEFPEMGNKSPQLLEGTPVTIHLYSKKPDAVFEAAVAAGAKVVMPMANQFWGDRYGIVMDPYGHQWSIAAQVEKLSPKQMKKRMEAMMAGPCEEPSS